MLMEKPAPYFDFLWTDDIVAHIAEHSISQDDFEYVVCNPERRRFSRSSGRPAAWGHTIDGRFAVFEEIDDMTILPVTTYEVPEPR